MLLLACIFRSCWSITLLLHLFVSAAAAFPRWKHYPLVLENNEALTFPRIEGNQDQFQSDSWFLTAEVRGRTTGKRYQIVTDFDRNNITGVTLNFYFLSIFDLETGDFNTYTSWDLPGTKPDEIKFAGASGHLDLSFDSPYGRSYWNTSRKRGDDDGNGSQLDAFNYDLDLTGRDIVTSRPFGFSGHVNMLKKPVAFGAAHLRGFFTFFKQPNTLTYWQPGPLVEGTLSFNSVTEQVVGMRGHMDRQSWPLYSGVNTPTGREQSHEWRQINFDNGIDLSIWRQLDRKARNSLMNTTGVTVSFPPPGPWAEPPEPLWVDGLPSDLTVEYISYSKFPSKDLKPVFPSPSQNMYLANAHVIRSKALNMTLRADYVNPAPYAQLPVEYFDGPAIWQGTFMGQPVSGTGIYESTFALYRDWELATVLFDSVSHLPERSFSAQAPRRDIVQIIKGLQARVSEDSSDDHRDEARTYLDTHVVPALDKIADETRRANMLEIAADFKASLDLDLPF